MPIIERKCTRNVMPLNHLKTIPPAWCMEKLPSMKSVPGAQKAGGHCPYVPLPVFLCLFTLVPGLSSLVFSYLDYCSLSDVKEC